MSFFFAVTSVDMRLASGEELFFSRHFSMISNPLGFPFLNSRVHALFMVLQRPRKLEENWLDLLIIIRTSSCVLKVHFDDYASSSPYETEIFSLPAVIVG